MMRHPSIATRWGRLGRTGLLLTLAGLLLVGGAWWWRHRPPALPEMPLDGLDAEVVDALQEARSAVSQQPRSGTAWGTLGQTLLANELYPDSSLACFHAAQRFDPTNPR